MSDKLYLVPPAVQDIAAALNNTGKDHERETYISRLQAIRDFCDATINKATSLNTPLRPTEKVVKSTNRKPHITW